MAYTKPLPEPRGLTQEFYDWCKKHELRFQRCSDCNVWRHVPREMCADCGSWNWQWAQSSGRGKLFTWTVAERPLHAGFVDAVPYASVVVEMDEGVRIVSEVVDQAPSDLQMDMPVEVTFDDVTDEITLPKFRRTD